MNVTHDVGGRENVEKGSIRWLLFTSIQSGLGSLEQHLHGDAAAGIRWETAHLK